MSKKSWKWHVSLILALGGAPRADLHRKPPSTMGHESLIQRRPSLSHPVWLKYFFSDIQSVTLNYHTPRLICSCTITIIKSNIIIFPWLQPFNASVPVVPIRYTSSSVFWFQTEKKKFYEHEHLMMRKCQKLMMMTTVMTIIRMTWILPFVIVSQMQLSDLLRKWKIQIWNSSSSFLQIWNYQKSLPSICNILNSMQKYLRIHLATENIPTVLFVEIFNFLYSFMNRWGPVEKHTLQHSQKTLNSTYSNIAILIPCCGCAGPSA